MIKSVESGERRAKGAGSPLTDVLNPHQVKSGVWRVESGAEGTRLPPLQGEGDRRAVEGF